MFTENNSIFLNDFGVDCVFQLNQTAETFSARAIYDAAEMDGDLGGSKITATQPRISLPLDSIPKLSRGDFVVCSDPAIFPQGPTRFRVLEIINEGTGWATIALSSATAS